MLTAAMVRSLLMIDMAGMAVLALFFLRHRRMDWVSYCGWGLLAIGVPVLGPFLVIARRPGVWDPNFSVVNDLKRLAEFLQRLLPDEPIVGRKKTTLADRVRRRRQTRDHRTVR